MKAFILPGLTHLKLFEGRLNKKQKMEDFVIIGFGILGSIIGSADALKRIGIIPDYSGREETGF